jgi:hypothetical protein
MTQEEKDLVLIDLCGRLPYDIKIKDEYGDYINVNLHNANIEHLIDRVVSGIDKMVLRPISSMTKEEEDELCKLCTLSDCNVNSDWEAYGVEIIYSHPRYGTYFATDYSAIEWLNKNMFDYRGLIPKGLAKAAPEGMYSN